MSLTMTVEKELLDCRAEAAMLRKALEFAEHTLVHTFDGSTAHCALCTVQRSIAYSSSAWLEEHNAKVRQQTQMELLKTASLIAYDDQIPLGYNVSIEECECWLRTRDKKIREEAIAETIARLSQKSVDDVPVEEK